MFRLMLVCLRLDNGGFDACRRRPEAIPVHTVSQAEWDTPRIGYLEVEFCLARCAAGLISLRARRASQRTETLWGPTGPLWLRQGSMPGSTANRCKILEEAGFNRDAPAVLGTLRYTRFCCAPHSLGFFLLLGTASPS